MKNMSVTVDQNVKKYEDTLSWIHIDGQSKLSRLQDHDRQMVGPHGRSQLWFI